VSKRITTRWFIGAWIVAVLALLGGGVLGRGAPGSTPPAAVTFLGLVILVCGIVMVVTWVAALIRLAQIHAWGWLLFVLLVFLLTAGLLGILVMLVYAVAGPDARSVVATRPTVT
jgi:hypothetical protein